MGFGFCVKVSTGMPDEMVSLGSLGRNNDSVLDGFVDALALERESAQGPFGAAFGPATPALLIGIPDGRPSGSWEPTKPGKTVYDTRCSVCEFRGLF